MNTLDGFVAGDTVTLRLRVTPLDDEPTDSSTEARVELTAPSGNAVALSATPDADRDEWVAILGDVEAGEYVGRWIVTGTGEGTESVRVLVAPAPGADVERSYATTGDLARYMRAAPPVAARRLLARATERIDELLVAAVYPVTGPDELPADPEVADALRKATCAQAAWFDESGDETGSGAAERWSNVRIGNVQLGGAGGSGDGASAAAGRYAPDALRTLRLAGLFNPSNTAPRIAGSGYGGRYR
ncbi:hypothetical protein [Pseudonocardia sp. McavD-2-B]|uniref:hypothetical protein n=1 Tax=Pseudonocardia sp. McavD-2-B TaxID=2954499 RepID=UPI0020974817|nr:hypothetical protein [Pseudonocardia sp. McavD-2-B]MCO7196899.1 hypothetical protein [Pseudonocardia sp. McavD-2-B]